MTNREGIDGSSQAIKVAAIIAGLFTLAAALITVGVPLLEKHLTKIKDRTHREQANEIKTTAIGSRDLQEAPTTEPTDGTDLDQPSEPPKIAQQELRDQRQSIDRQQDAVPTYSIDDGGFVTIQHARTTVSASFDFRYGRRIVTLNISPRSGSQVTEAVLGPGVDIEFINKTKRHLLHVHAINFKVRKIVVSVRSESD